jgi:hypothetical protein
MKGDFPFPAHGHSLQQGEARMMSLAARACVCTHVRALDCLAAAFCLSWVRRKKTGALARQPPLGAVHLLLRQTDCGDVIIAHGQLQGQESPVRCEKRTCENSYLRNYSYIITENSKS